MLLIQSSANVKTTSSQQKEATNTSIVSENDIISFIIGVDKSTTRFIACLEINISEDDITQAYFISCYIQLKWNNSNINNNKNKQTDTNSLLDRKFQFLQNNLYHARIWYQNVIALFIAYHKNQMNKLTTDHAIATSEIKMIEFIEKNEGYVWDFSSSKTRLGPQPYRFCFEKNKSL